MVAVLAEAINCFHKYHGAQRPRGRRLFREAEAWLLTEHDNWPFAFDNICDVTGLDAGCLRAALQRWRDRHCAASVRRDRVLSARRRSWTSRERHPPRRKHVAKLSDMNRAQARAAQ